MRSSSKRIQWLVHVDTTQLDLNHEFKLSRIRLPDAGNSGETIYEVKSLEQPSQVMKVILVRKSVFEHLFLLVALQSPLILGSISVA